MKNLFSSVIHDAFHKESNEPDPIEIQEEIDHQIEKLELDYKSNGKEEYFLIACLDEKIIGTLSFGKAGSVIQEQLKEEALLHTTLKSAYVLVPFQSQGIAKMLFLEIIKEIHKRNHSFFYFDCGYALAQEYYLKHFGKPNIKLLHYWGRNCHHSIWKCEVKKFMNL